jgi:ABC-type bacteriocin/lantibiotic exporter with double-glycine peptidase domain
MIQQIVDFFASFGAEVEALFHSDAITLPDFPRSIQLDDYSCGAKVVYCILQYYDKQCTLDSVERLLKTDEDGTSVSDIKRVLNRYGLVCRTLRKPGLRDLKAAIDDDCPVLVSLYDGSHYAVIYGYSSSHIFVSNPSLNVLTGYGSIRCAIPNAEFRKVWDKWAVVLSK